MADDILPECVSTSWQLANTTLRGVAEKTISEALVTAGPSALQPAEAAKEGERPTGAPSPLLLHDAVAMAALHCVFGRLLSSAASIAFFRAEPMTFCYLVVSERDELRGDVLAAPRRWLYEVGAYVCLPPLSCTCTAFKYQVLQRRAAETCKHLLAIELLCAEARRQRRADDDPVAFRSGQYYTLPAFAAAREMSATMETPPARPPHDGESEAADDMQHAMSEELRAAGASSFVRHRGPVALRGVSPDVFVKKLIASSLVAPTH